MQYIVSFKKTLSLVSEWDIIKSYAVVRKKMELQKNVDENEKEIYR